ncbi:Fungalysin metallopeptidase-domain-containing protein [Mucidula mucida]|nr:Fungalysin metallopeptidase-domain-containing protein [Mucidula mucida]
MVSFTKLLSFVLLAVSANAAPWPAYSKHATHRTRYIGRDLKIETYHPKTTYQTFGSGKESISFTASSFSADSLEDHTLSFIASELGIDTSNVGFTKGYTPSDALSYSYAKQMHEGVSFANAVANVAFKNGKVVAFGSSFVDASNIAPSTPSIDVDSVISTVEEQLSGKFNGVKSLKYLTKPDGSIALTHTVQVQNSDTNAWFEAFVDAHTGELLSVTDFVAQATYTVTPITKDAVTDGQETLTDPEDLDSSPNGWVDGTETAGNNVVAYKSSQSATTSESSSGVFDYPYDTDVGPTDGKNVDAARVNAFYIINTVHDFLYKYGWTEAAFNFQNDNFGKDGEGDDRVLMSVQDASGTDNANFATPPDGQSGTCRMYIWDITTPERDGSLQNDIIVHEFTHGLTNRMTGGGTGACLQTTESGGMGEGWSDSLAAWTEQKSADVHDYAMATWVVNDTAGIRTHPYSTDSTVNPLRYSSIQELNEVHDIGEVWANMLYNVYAALVAEHGWSATAMSDASGSEGNIVYLHLFVDALALQPCNPTLVAARDAWIQADENRYDGANKCIIWQAFASRGLGVNAANFEDDETVPDDC